jgi:hypothetical protein
LTAALSLTVWTVLLCPGAVPAVGFGIPATSPAVMGFAYRTSNSVTHMSPFVDKDTIKIYRDTVNCKSQRNRKGCGQVRCPGPIR